MACLALHSNGSFHFERVRWAKAALVLGMILGCDPKVGAVSPDKGARHAGPTCQPSAENCGCKPCPVNPDPDNDSVLTAVDACPDVPEDLDGFQDDDGCPDPDNDGDGILDAASLKVAEDGSYTWENHDRRMIGSREIDCRDRPEDVDGVDDDDGCPEVVAIRHCQLVPSGKVVFDYDKETIRPKSFPVLDEIVAEMQATPELLVRVENHKADDGADVFGRRPTRNRAISVQKYLLNKGIAPERLEAEGFGESRPIETNKTPEGRAENRRTEFWIIDCEW